MHFSACTLLAPYLHQFSAVVQFMLLGAVWDKFLKFGANLAKFTTIHAETAPYIMPD